MDREVFAEANFSLNTCLNTLDWLPLAGAGFESIEKLSELCFSDDPIKRLLDNIDRVKQMADKSHVVGMLTFFLLIVLFDTLFGHFLSVDVFSTFTHNGYKLISDQFSS